jgi:hypothetical protein
MKTAVQFEHQGLRVVALGDRIKALLEPLEAVCRYREQRGDDSASFDVTPRAKEALAFKISIAPGGIDLECPAFAIRELALDDTEIAVAIATAILNGRVRQVLQLKRSGAAGRVKTYVFDAEGRLVYKNRKSRMLPFLMQRPAAMARVRFSAYSGS